MTWRIGRESDSPLFTVKWVPDMHPDRLTHPAPLARTEDSVLVGAVLHPGVFGDASLLEPPEQPVVCFDELISLLSRSLALKGPTPVCFFRCGWWRCEWYCRALGKTWSWLRKLKVCIFLKGIGALVDAQSSQLKLIREVWCVFAFQQPRKRLQDISACVGGVRPDGFWCHLHYVHICFQQHISGLHSSPCFECSSPFPDPLHIFHASLFIADECEYCCGNASSGQVLGIGPKWIILICLVTKYSFFPS